MQFNSLKKVIYLHDCMIGMHLPPFYFHPKGEVPFVSTLEALEGTKYISCHPALHLWKAGELYDQED